MAEPRGTQTITSTSNQQKSVPVVTVESFYNSHAEKLQMKLEGPRVGFHRKIRGVPHPNDYNEVHQRRHDCFGDGFFADGDRIRQHGGRPWHRRFDSRSERHRKKRVRAWADRAWLQL